MKAADVDDALVQRAREGDLDALEALLRRIQGMVYNLAVRMLGQREDAQDATQEVLLRVTTHLASFRGDSAFTTWVWRIASNHLLTARTRVAESPERTFENFAEHLERGLVYGQTHGGASRPLLPEEKLEARRMALSCTQAMLSCLDRPQRLAYVLAVVIGLDSPEAAAVQGIPPATHRKRLSRAREALEQFMQSACGLVSGQAACRCERQLPAAAEARRRGRVDPDRKLAVSNAELDLAESGLRELLQMSDAAAVMRGAPAYAAPESMLRGIRIVVERSAFLRH